MKKRSLFCWFRMHSYVVRREYLYIEQIEEDEVKVHYFFEYVCGRCGFILKPSCFKKKWVERHKPFKFEREDYPGLFLNEVWNLWEVTKERIFGE